MEKGIITGLSTANVVFMDFGIQRHWRNIWIYVGSINLFIFLCIQKTQKLNLPIGIKRFQFLYLFTPTQRLSALSMKPADSILMLDTSFIKKLRSVAQLVTLLLIKKLEVIIMVLKVRNASKIFYGGSERAPNLILR